MLIEFLQGIFIFIGVSFGVTGLVHAWKLWKGTHPEIDRHEDALERCVHYRRTNNGNIAEGESDAST